LILIWHEFIHFLRVLEIVDGFDEAGFGVFLDQVV